MQDLTPLFARRCSHVVRIQDLTPLFDLKIMKYGDTVIKAWSGVYELDLPEPFFLLAYDAGLGSKNSQGFGMVEVVKKRTVAMDQ